MHCNRFVVCGGTRAYSIHSYILGINPSVLSLPIHLLNSSGRLDNFTISTRDAIALAFSGSVVTTPISAAYALTSVFIRSTYSSAWPNVSQGNSGQSLASLPVRSCEFTSLNPKPDSSIQVRLNKLTRSPFMKPHPADLVPAGKGTDYATIDFDICLSTALYDNSSLYLLAATWCVGHGEPLVGVYTRVPSMLP